MYFGSFSSMPLYLPPAEGTTVRTAAGTKTALAANAKLAQCNAEQEYNANVKKREEDRKAFAPEIHKALEFYGFNIRGEAYRDVSPIYVEAALNAIADELGVQHGNEWDFHPTSSTRAGTMPDAGQEQVFTKLANHDPSLPHVIHNLQQRVFSRLTAADVPPIWLPLYEIPEWAGPPGDSAGHIWQFRNGFWDRIDIDPIVHFVACDPVTFVPEGSPSTGSSLVDRAAAIEAEREAKRQAEEAAAIVDQQVAIERQVQSSKLKKWSLVGAGAAALGLTALLLSRRSS